jgi:hypothetical protein
MYKDFTAGLLSAWLLTGCAAQTENQYSDSLIDAGEKAIDSTRQLQQSEQIIANNYRLFIYASAPECFSQSLEKTTVIYLDGSNTEGKLCTEGRITDSPLDLPVYDHTQWVKDEALILEALLHYISALVEAKTLTPVQQQRYFDKAVQNLKRVVAQGEAGQLTASDGLEQSARSLYTAIKNIQDEERKASQTRAVILKNADNIQCTIVAMEKSNYLRVGRYINWRKNMTAVHSMVISSSAGRSRSYSDTLNSERDYQNLLSGISTVSRSLPVEKYTEVKCGEDIDYAAYAQLPQNSALENLRKSQADIINIYNGNCDRSCEQKQRQNLIDGFKATGKIVKDLVESVTVFI